MNAPNPIPVKRPGRTWKMPVAVVNRMGHTVAEFESIAHAVAVVGIGHDVLKAKLESGEPWLVWFRYADMPANVQPLVDAGTARPRKVKKVVRKGRARLTPKEDPYAPGGRLHALAAMRNKTKG